MKDDISYEIKESIGSFGKRANGWEWELNKISWNGGETKYDLRPWAPDHARMGKGITLTAEELLDLQTILSTVLL